MGDSGAYPVFRTADATVAYARAERLRRLMSGCEEVGLHAELRTAGQVRRMAAGLPEGTFDHAEPRTGPTGGAPG